MPERSLSIPFECACGYEAMLPVKGRVIAVNGDDETGDTGILFDVGQSCASPAVIQCRKCRRTLTNKPEEENDVR